jgi:hypothetical protein
MVGFRPDKPASVARHRRTGCEPPAPVGVLARWAEHPSGKQRRPDELSTNRVSVSLIRGEPSTRGVAVCQVTA